MFTLATGCSSCSRQTSSQEQLRAPSAASLASPPSSSPTERDDEKPYTIVEVRHVVFHESSGIRLRAEWLQGRLYPTHKGVVPSLDDPKSFKIEVEQGETAISVADLSALLRDTVFRHSKLSGIHLKPRGQNQVEITGTLHELVPVPVDLTGDIGATGDGRISIHIDHLKAFKIPLKGMLDFMHLKPASLMRTPPEKGMEAHGDSLYLSTTELLPPPRKTGIVTSVHFTPGGELEQDYGHRPGEKPALADWDRSRWRNYIRLSGGTIQFGKVTMQSADLTLLDASPGDWFQFDLLQYRAQLVAGQMRMTPSGGLRVFVPDVTRLHLHTGAPPPRAAP